MSERARRAAEVEGTAPILELVDVAIEYPKQGRIPAFRAVEGANLLIRPGEVVGLVGESGSGKTTIGRAAVGLLPVVEGTLTVAGVELTVRDAKKLRSLRRKVGMVFQDPSSSLNPRLPVGESIGEPMYLAGVAKGEALQKRIEELLDQVAAAAQLPQPVPARAVGRAEAARRHRPRDLAVARAAGRRRADLRARRVRAGAPCWSCCRTCRRA